mmetsp:Transcript_20660/g.37900  ORF Transcript_20660/g.37900 Transcript_20660/m.37900 type:complete len:247 (-) Transcript_20660:36-776(-)
MQLSKCEIYWDGETSTTSTISFDNASKIGSYFVHIQNTNKMKSCILATTLTLITSAAAFAPTQKAGPITSLSAANNKFASEIGAQAPLGFYDPMGFLASEDQAQFNWIREAEIKHGRISMLAVVGYLTTYSGVRIPGMEDIPSGFGVFDSSLYYTSDLATANVRWTLVTLLILETVFVKDAYLLAEHPGDYLNGLKIGRWDSRPDAYKIDQRAKELNNGRAAMMGILGLMVHESLGNVDELLQFLK